MTVEFGLALENFTPERKVPDMDAITAYSATAEELGFASVWAWDHLFLGARRPFPFLEALTTLSWVAARTSRILLGTGVLVLPIREPAIVAKAAATLQLASGGRLMLGVASGWYEREFDATAVPFRQRGQIFERNLDLMLRLWADDDVTGEWDGRVLTHVRMLPLPRPRPQLLIGGYVDRVLRRVATRSDGWVTYFYTAESIARAWSAIRGYAEEAGRDPARLNVVAQVPLCIGSSYEKASRRANDDVVASTSTPRPGARRRRSPRSAALRSSAPSRSPPSSTPASGTWCSARTTTRPNRCTGWPPRCCRCSAGSARELADGAVTVLAAGPSGRRPGGRWWTNG